MLLMSELNYKKADRTAKPSRRKSRVWNRYGSVRTLPLTIQGAEISAVWIFATVKVWLNTTHVSQS